MKKFVTILIALGLFGFANSANAQLPANPWEINPNDGVFENVDYGNSAKENVNNAPLIDGSGNIVAVDPWAKARDKSGIETWRGSGQHGRLDYVGDATTYGTAMGQEMIAPEVNRHNMLVSLEHLRSLGYKIPDSYDEGIKNAPANYAKTLRKKYDEVHQDSSPFGQGFVWIMDGFEKGTGLDIENILFNSLNILGTD